MLQKYKKEIKGWWLILRKSMTFNGIRKPWLYLLEGRQKSPFPPVRNNLIRVTGMAGAHVSSKETDVIYIQQPIGFIADTDEEFLERKDELAKWLNTNKAVPLQFDDEPERTYYAEIDGTIEDFTKFSNQRRGIITFLCADPYGYGHEKTYHFPSDQVIVENNGTAEADPIFELTATQKTTFVMISNEDDEYNLIGQPADVDVELVDERQTIIDERGETLSQWTASPIKIDSHTAVISGSLGTDSTGIVPLNYGTGDKWHGPARAIEINPIQDFEVEMFCRVELTRPTDTFRIETYLFDENLKVIGKIAIVDSTINNSQVAAEGRQGDWTGSNENYAISSRNYQRNGSHFHGLVRMTRKGNQIIFYVARLSSGDNPIHHDTLRVSRNVTDGNLLGRLKYIQIHFGKFGSSTSALVPRINRLKVTELNEVLVDQTPYILNIGDVVTFDHKNEDILVNGAVRPDLFTEMGADFFKLKEGYNNLVVTPANSFETKMRYQERFR